MSEAEFLRQSAEKWQGDSDPSTTKVCNWFVEHCPLRSEEKRRNLLEGLRMTGLD